jgi:hypothetical protein
VTAEPHLPIPFDPTPYGALDASDPFHHRGEGRGSDASSAPVPQPSHSGQPAGALPLLEICPTCLIELDEYLYCSGCSYLAPIRREDT